jgi:phage I-like protein
MNTVLLNREFKLPADSRFQIVPMGEYPITTEDNEKLVQVVDAEAVTKILANFENDARKPNFAGVLVDYDHFSLDTSKESRAAGWCVSAERGASGIDGEIKLSNSGRKDVEGGDYRFLSPVFDKASAEHLGGNRYRVTRLARLAVTNDPNMKGMVPLSNRIQPEAGPITLPQERGDLTRRSAGGHPTNTKPMKSIATKLGLSADASEEGIVSEIAKLQNRATEAETKVTALTTERDTLKNRVTQTETEQIDADLDGHGVKDEALRNRLKPILGAMKNREERVSLLRDVVAKPAGAERRETLTNRNKAKTPDARKGKDGEAEGDDEEDDKAMAEKIKNRATELQASLPNRSFTSCWGQARSEIMAKRG